MDPIRLVQFDIHGTNPVNKIPGEVWTVDPSCEWIIPNGSPFFAEAALTVVYNQAGGILKLGRDYFFDGEVPPLCAVTGRSICTFIRLSDEVLKANKTVSIDYQSLGAYFVPRSNLQDWLNAIRSGKKPIPYSKVFQAPATLPPSWHAHSAKTELGDWFEMTNIFKMLTQARGTIDPGLGDEGTKAIERAYTLLKPTKDQVLAKMKVHDKNYAAPHGTTKSDLLLGNVVNYATATPAEDVAGTRNDLYSTPRGLQDLAMSLAPDTSKVMRSGIVPLSRFGGESFIPPNISGSFEGLGSVAETTGFCIEANGTLMMLTNHFDGRQEGLYYSYMEDYRAQNPKIVYSGFKYKPPVLEALGVVPTAIIGGSNNKVIMVGVPGTNDWFVALSNGTFDPSAHGYVKVDMSAVNALYGTQVYNNQMRSTLHFMGDYLILTQFHGNGANDRLSFFRIAVNKLIAGTTVKWELLNLTYQDYDGKQFTNVGSFSPMVPERDANNRYTRNGPWTYRQSCSSINKAGPTASLSTPKPDAAGIYFLHMLFACNAIYIDPVNGGVSNVLSVLDMGTEFNPATGAINVINKTAPLSIGFTDTNAAQRDAYLNLYRNWYNYALGSYTASGVVLDTGEVLYTSIVDANAFPAAVGIFRFTGKDTPAKLLGSGLDTTAAPVARADRILAYVSSPLLSGTFPSSMTYDGDGEIFAAVDSVTLSRRLYFRQVTGGYQIRPEVANLVSSPVYSRPLSNQVYYTNITQQDMCIGLTGSAAELADAGVECGSTGFSSFSYTSYAAASNRLPRINEFKSPTEAASNLVFSFPKTHKRTLNAASKMATYEAQSFYGVRQNILDKLKAQIPAAYAATAAWTVTWVVLDTQIGGMFKNMNNLMMAVITFLDQSRAQSRAQLLMINPTVEAPNADHPDVHLIKDFTVLDAPGDFRLAANVRFQDVRMIVGNQASKQKALFTGYKDGDKLNVFFVSPYTINSTAAESTRQYMVFDIDLVTKKFSNINAGYSGWSLPDLTTPIPKVGMADYSVQGAYPETHQMTNANPTPYLNTGGAARLLKKTAADGTAAYYIGPTAYPETGWSVFFQEDVTALINGTSYKVAGGSVDLRDIEPAPGNKTFYVYLTIEDDKPQYIFATKALRKTNTMMRVATISTNATQITSIVREQPFMIGDLLLSFTREGGIIPLSTGFPQDEGQFAFVRQAELLP